MDWTTLTSLYPVAEKLAERVPRIKSWLEERAKKEDPFLFTYLEHQQALSEIGSLASRMDSLVSRTDSIASGMDSLVSRTDSLASGINSLASRMDSLVSRTDSIASGMDSLAKGLRRYNLFTSLLGAKLSNPNLSQEDIIRGVDFAEKAVETADSLKTW